MSDATQTTEETPIPSPLPGSEEAIEKGCRCPVIDNHYGKGNSLGQFWISGDCPLHGIPNG